MLNEPSPKRSCSQSILARGIRTLRPPFMHVKLAFHHADVGATSDSKSMTAYFLSFNQGMCKTRFGFTTNLYGFMKVTVPEQTLAKLVGILNRMVEESKHATNPHQVSMWKSSNIGQTARFFCCMSPLPLPNKDTRDWTCSEIVCYVLQEVGVIEKTIHPTYVDSSELFLILKDKTNVDSNALSPIKYDPKGSVKRENTSAETRYCHAMKCQRTKIPSYDKLKFLSSRVIPQ